MRNLAAESSYTRLRWTQKYTHARFQYPALSIAEAGHKNNCDIMIRNRRKIIIFKKLGELKCFHHFFYIC